MGLENAYFGMQCFWGESVFAKLKGVHNTRVGYAGGKTKNPTYKGIADHTEVTEVKFDPSVLSYRELVDFFWSHHDPVGPRKKQYQSAILYANDEQKKARRIAEETKQREEKKHEDIETYIEPIDVFYQAEDYHQKYWLRCKRDIFESLHLTDEQVADSLLATKLNAYAAGYTDFSELEQLKKEHNLSDELVKKIHDFALAGGDPRNCH
ncbi:hypothetical protein WR25_23909 [Diploscapter pachys]|uniref:peptide-methionine (S)-S-oxide reductase n=1 Tax=Diploscapter pachys TaxID=2018661 RepID=A0A2A2KDI8_9BILA|nr:hypothetical protein WR25_23909 [Diploscapter pachys]